MARVLLKEGTDVPALKKALKKRGLVLRRHKDGNGAVQYFLHRNPYLPPMNLAEFMKQLNELQAL